MKQLFILFFLVFQLLICRLPADDIMISGSGASMNLLYFVKPSLKTTPVVYDIGIPKGGIDVNSDEMSDKSTIVLKNPDLRDLNHPFMLVLGVRGTAGQRVDITFGILEGGTSYGTASSKLEVYLDDTELKFEKKQLNANGNLAFVTLRSTFILKDSAPHLIFIRPLGNVKCFIDAIKLSSERKINCLNAKIAEKSSGLNLLQSLYWKKVFRKPENTKRKVLVMNFLSGYGRHFEYGTVKQMGFETKASKWILPDKWGKYDIVILSTRHKLSIKENQAIEKYVENGGIVVATPGSLMYFVARNKSLKNADLKWTGGFRGAWVKYPDGTFYMKKNPGFENGSLDFKFKDKQLSMRSRETNFFIAGSKEQMKYAPYLMWHSQHGERGAGVVIHPYRKGFFVGFPIPQTLRLQSILQNILQQLKK